MARFKIAATVNGVRTADGIELNLSPAQAVVMLNRIMAEEVLNVNLVTPQENSFDRAVKHENPAAYAQ